LLILQLLEELHFILLIITEFVPELFLNTAELCKSQFEELLGGDLLFLIKILSELQLFLDMADGVL
jgi:hypothetical protein